MKTIFLLLISVCITMMLQAQVSKTVEVTAGNMEKAFTNEEFRTVTNLTLTGTIDAWDFKTLSYMPSLTELDLSEVKIVESNGSFWSPVNAIPTYAFIQMEGEQNDHLKSVKLPLSCRTIMYRAFSGCSGLTSILIPPSVVRIENEAFNGCTGLKSITFPSTVTFQDAPSIFANCTGSIIVYVPYLSNNYFTENDSIKIVEMPLLELSANVISMSAVKDITETIDIDSDSIWTVSSNKSWLTVNPASGKGNQKLTISADINNLETRRTALLTFKIDTVIVNSVVVYQTGITKLINVPANIFLKSLLTDKEIELVTSLTLSGTIDVRDFSTIRRMSLLSEIDLSGVDILAGTDVDGRNYPANTIPVLSFGFWGNSIGSNPYQYKSILLPYTCTSIDNWAFLKCLGLTSITIPSSVTSFGRQTFTACSNLTSFVLNSGTPIDLSSSEFYDVFGGIDKNNCTLYVPYGSKSLYSVAAQWQEFKNIVEIPFIEVFKNQLNLAASKGSTATTKIVSDVNWITSSDQTWLKLSQTSGTGDPMLTFTAEANPTSNTRTAQVTVSADGVESQTITVTQEGGTTALPDLAETSTQIKCYPNPFTDEITIEIQNPKQAEISVDIYNMAGGRIKNLAIQRKDEKLDLKWNGTNDSGQKVVSGVYICKVNNQAKRMIYQASSH